MQACLLMRVAAVVVLIGAAAPSETRSAETLPREQLPREQLPREHESRIVQAQPEAPVTTRRTVSLTEEDRHTIREIILKETAIERAPANVEVAIGDAVPDNVKLDPFPDDVTRKVPQVKASAFFVKDDEIVIVDPKDRKVADIVR